MQITTRRGFWSSLWAAVVALITGSSANAASKTDLSQIKVNAAGLGLIGYANGGAVPVTVGTGLAISGGVLTASGASTGTPTTAVLARDANGNYPLPAGVRVRTKVYRNGIRQALAVDYDIVSDVVVPVAAFPWDLGALVLADGE